MPTFDQSFIMVQVLLTKREALSPSLSAEKGKISAEGPGQDEPASRTAMQQTQKLFFKIGPSDVRFFQ